MCNKMFIIDKIDLHDFIVTIIFITFFLHFYVILFKLFYKVFKYLFIISLLNYFYLLF
jgi:hypothetical protein